MKKTVLTLLALTALVACKNESKTETTETIESVERVEVDRTPEEQIAYKIAQANGVENWDEVTEIQFTFNVDRGDSHFARTWKWNPKSDDVTMMSEQDTVAYNRKSVDSLSMNADKGFINDAFWLLAPMHLVWDEGTTLTVQDTATAPMSEEKMSKITLTYDGDGGYTPGDAYDFFYDEDYRVQEWVYRRGNVSEFSMVTTWEGYKDYNGIEIASDHKAPEDAVHLYFTDIAVKTEED
ncbi:hypothetical protein [Leeuwenhoekiella marinoflava]|uniref:Lipoprotein n=2 Tax=Leeuwenhoekiella marinoflava TaxID=988 RepID=A0A4Q0PIE0_9FLAO|nr:hypothetical protein [Leeuwenhoekiella marinoflava]RXG26854.1 hypothetical protein DSL99_3164 [Leeuwenhoekiella marinoflava]SHF39393.1 hypothetical protein SAMN02745246_02367 [Leeuwenhoekiella marinoflava DSM 3653]